MCRLTSRLQKCVLGSTTFGVCTPLSLSACGSDVTLFSFVLKRATPLEDNLFSAAGVGDTCTPETTSPLGGDLMAALEQLYLELVVGIST